MGARERLRQCDRALEAWLEAEREQLVLWLPVMLGAGVTAWFLLPDAPRWIGLILGGVALGLLSVALPGGGRAPRVAAIAGLTLAAGCALIWLRSERVAAPVLARPAVVLVTARVERVEQLPARELTRVTLAPIGHADLPPRIRLNLDRAEAAGGDCPRRGDPAAGAIDAATLRGGTRRL
jgi:competence protein ComEC